MKTKITEQMITNLEKQIDSMSDSDIKFAFRGHTSPGEVLYAITSDNVLAYNSDYHEMFENEEEEAMDVFSRKAYDFVEKRFGQTAKEWFR